MLGGVATAPNPDYVAGSRLPKEKILETHYEYIPDKSAETIGTIMTEYVAVGGTIKTDGMPSYSKLARDQDWHHEAVNHNKFLKDPDTGVIRNFRIK